jgi:hypothetical protein
MLAIVVTRRATVLLSFRSASLYGFAEVKRAPKALADRIAEIPGKLAAPMMR